MALNDITKTTSDIKSQVESIVTDNIDYYKLLGFKTATKSAAALVKIFVVGLLCLLVVFFLAMAGGFALSEYWDNYAYGFLAMAGVLCVLLFVVLLLKKYIIDFPVLRRFHKMLNNEN